MKRACIAIVDATRARLYTYERADDDEPARPESGALHEVMDLRAGSTEDHRDAHAHEIDRRFARQVVAELDRIAREHAFPRVVLVASPAMLGEVRGVTGALRRPELVVEYVARDLAQLSSPQIHDHLAQLSLIPPRRPAFAPG